ncbi:MAG: CoA transferase [Chloroflexi bacterium]|nr:CoA transferase [Chloroflexota bacterium]
MPLPLEGVRILSNAIVWAGPYATMLLADLGAELIEIENIRHLNITRTQLRFPPPGYFDGAGGNVYSRRDSSGRFWDRQAYFNYGKRSHKGVTVDISRPEGRALFLRLVAHCDVFLENNAAGVMEKMRLNYDALKAANPQIIMMRFPGFGLDGPYQHYKGYGANVEAVVGHTWLRGYLDGDPSETSPIYHADPAAGAHVAFAIMTALLYRRRTGKGQLIDHSQAEGVIHHLAHSFMDYSMNKRVQGGWENHDTSMAPHGVYPAAGEDRWIAIACPSDEAFATLCDLMGAEGLATDPRFADTAARYRNQAELDPIVAAWSATQNRDDMMRRLQAAGIPAMSVFDQFELLHNEQLRARGYFEQVTHPEAGTFEYPAAMAKFSATPMHIRTHAPTLGQHNEEIYKGLLGMSDEEYQRLQETQIIGDTYTDDAHS